MSLKHWFLATVSLVAAAAIAGLATGLWTAHDEGGPGAVARIDPGGPDPGPERPEEALSLENPTVRDVHFTQTTTWEVRVVNPKGALLPDARITAIDAEGDSLPEALGRVTWDPVDPGDWNLRVEHSDFPTFESAVAVVEGRSNRKIVRLDTRLHVGGRIIDRFGTKKLGERLWFLQPGADHPLSSAAAESLQTVVSDREGRFKIALPEAGRWRVSVGIVGQEKYSMPTPHELSFGGPDWLEIVLPETTSLEVQSPLGGVRAMRDFQFAVLQRRDAPVAGPGMVHGLRGGGDRAVGLGEGQSDPETISLPPDRDQPDDPSRPDWDSLPEWTPRGSARVDSTGVVVFRNLPAGREFRLRMSRRGQRLDSVESFQLRTNERMVLEVEPPPPSLDEDFESEPQPISIRVRTEPLTPDDPRPGFHWTVLGS